MYGPLHARSGDDTDGRVTGINGARKRRRDAYVDGAFVEHAVYDRAKLPVSETIAGPAIIEESESTTLVGPDATFRVDAVGNLLVEQ